MISSYTCKLRVAVKIQGLSVDSMNCLYYHRLAWWGGLSSDSEWIQGAVYWLNQYSHLDSPD